MSVRHEATGRSSRPTSSSRSAMTQPPLFPVLLKHPRCRPFFRLGSYGVVAARVELAPGPTRNAMHRVFDRDDVELLGGEPKRVHLRAKENLRALFESGAMTIRTGRTAAGHGYLGIEHPTLASSCLFLPGLTQSAATFLGGKRFAAVILRRDLIAVFHDQGSLRACADVARSIAEALVQNGATFDIDLFALDDVHPQPMLSMTRSAPPPPVPPTPRTRAHSASGMYPTQEHPRRAMEQTQLTTLEERGLQRPRIRLRSEPPPAPTSASSYKGHTQVIELGPASMDPPTIKATVAF